MSPQDHAILNGGAVTSAFEEHARGRIEVLTAVCLSTDSTLEQIRVAQAGIAEMQQIVTLRDRLRRQWESTP